MEQLDDQLAGADIRLSDKMSDRIDEIVPPGTDLPVSEANYNPLSLLNPNLRRRVRTERSAS